MLKGFWGVIRFIICYFLIQHVVIYLMLKLYMPINDLLAGCLLSAIIVIIIVLAKLLTMINNYILRSAIFKKLDTVFL